MKQTVEETRASKRRYYLKTRDRRRANMRRNGLKRNYGITEEDYDRMFREQHGCCAICGSTESGVKNRTVFCVDHDHKTDKVRSLLCFRCNYRLGFLDADKSWTDKALQYLAAHS